MRSPGFRRQARASTRNACSQTRIEPFAAGESGNYTEWADSNCGFRCEPVVDTKPQTYSAVHRMTLGIALGAYLVVHLLGVYLLRASGVGQDLFGRFRNVPDLPEPKQLSEYTAFVETHYFWDTEDGQAFDEIDEFEIEAVFWSRRRRRSA